MLSGRVHAGRGYAQHVRLLLLLLFSLSGLVVFDSRGGTV